MHILVTAAVAAVLSLLLASSPVLAGPKDTDSRCKVQSVRNNATATCRSIREYEEYEYEDEAVETTLRWIRTCLRFTVDGGVLDPKFKAGDSAANYQGKFWCPTRYEYNTHNGDGLDWGICEPTLPSVCFPWPTKAPALKPTTRSPTRFPTKPTTRRPTKKPTTAFPTGPTTRAPTQEPTQEPTATKSPTKPTKRATRSPTKKPTKPVTRKPTKKPITAFPTRPTRSTLSPSAAPVTEAPVTDAPVTTIKPTTKYPTKKPTTRSG